MTWQTLIIIQILVNAVMTIFTRHVTLSSKKLFFSIAVASYITVGIAGWVYWLIFNSEFSPLPIEVLPYLLAEGIFIPASWLVQYKLISHVGAGNATIVTTLNMLGTALLGILFLHEALTWQLILGTIFVASGVVIALRLKPDQIHKDSLHFRTKLGLALIGVVLFSVGMFAEKVAITMIGVWDYVAYGWSLQAVGAVTIYLLFGRKEASHVTRKYAGKGALLGLLTSISGGLYVYALSMGTLSQTIIATSGKVVVVMALAALFLHERNAFGYRLLAFAFTVCGIWLVIR